MYDERVLYLNFCGKTVGTVSLDESGNVISVLDPDLISEEEVSAIFDDSPLGINFTIKNLDQIENLIRKRGLNVETTRPDRAANRRRLSG